MRNNVNYLERAHAILSLIQSEKISSNPCNPILKVARNLCTSITNKTQISGLTSYIATTLCGVGLCQELSARFIVEYCLKYSEHNVGIVFLKSPGDTTHAFVYIKSPNTPDDLLTAGDQGNFAHTENTILTLQDFIDRKKSIIFIDPLINFAGDISNLNPFLNYCEHYNTKEIFVIRDYSSTPDLVEQAQNIKSNAQGIATEIKNRFKTSFAPTAREAGIFREKLSAEKNQLQNKNLLSSGVKGASGCMPPENAYLDENNKTVLPSR